jgi:hypothetical protein
MIGFERELGLVLLFGTESWKPHLRHAVRAVLPLQDHVNLAACGALFSASRAASNAPTLTPLLTLNSAIVNLFIDSAGGREPFRARPASYIAVRNGSHWEASGVNGSASTCAGRENGSVHSVVTGN